IVLLIEGQPPGAAEMPIGMGEGDEVEEKEEEEEEEEDEKEEEEEEEDVLREGDVVLAVG
ncbi:MAG: hypothetical protein Q9211_005667, partial [Gyalolechia sp. 1 TL-2023]